MILTEQRFGHLVSGRLYLAELNKTFAEHRDDCRKAYGNLHGVRFCTLPAGTKVNLAQSGQHWYLEQGETR